MRDIGLVLAGGGAKGAYFIGVWKALKEAGITKRISSISGTSVGALNGALFCIDNYNTGYEIWTSLKSKDILKVNYKRRLWAITKLAIRMSFNKRLDYLNMIKKRKIVGVFSRKGIESMMEKVDLDLVSKTYIDFYAGCYNLSKKQMEYLKLNYKSKEYIKKAILASSAIPFIFPSENIEGNLYYDGGIIDNVPIKPLYDKGIRDFIIVHLDRWETIDKNLYPDANLIEIRPSEQPGKTLDFSQELIRYRMELGYRDGKKALEKIQVSKGMEF